MRRTKEEAAATRQAVVGAALEVFAERGYSSATLADVAERAGVTRGAVYHHFDDKAALFLASVGEHWAAIDAMLWSPLEGEAPALLRVRNFVVSYLEAADQDPRLRRLLEINIKSEALPELEQGMSEKERAFDAAIERLSEVLGAAKTAGQLHPDVTPRHAAMLALSLVTGITTSWLLAPTLDRPSSVAQIIGDAWVRAVARAPADVTRRAGTAAPPRRPSRRSARQPHA